MTAGQGGAPDEARPRRDRRADALHAGGGARHRDGADADGARGAWDARPRDDDVPLAHAGLPLVDRDRSPSRRPRDPAPRLVAPRRAAARRVRLVLRRRPRGGFGTHAPGHACGDERRAPREERGNALRGARRRRLSHRGGQLHGVSRPHAPPSRRPAARRRARPRAVLLLQPLPGRPDRRAALVPEPCGWVDRRVRRGGRALARDARRVRLPAPLPLGLRLRLACRRPGRGDGGARPLRRGRRRARLGGRRARRVPRAVRRGRDVRSRPDGRARDRAPGRPVPSRAADARHGLEPGRSRLPPRCRGPCASRARGAPRRRAVGRGGALRGGGRRRRAAGGRRAPDRSRR